MNKKITPLILAVLALTACGESEDVPVSVFSDDTTAPVTETFTSHEETAAAEQTKRSAHTETAAAEQTMKTTHAEETAADNQITISTRLDEAEEENKSETIQSQRTDNIQFLSDYYYNDLKNLSEYDGNTILGASNGKIYDLNGDGKCILIADLETDITNNWGFNCYMTVMCSVNENGEVSIDTLADNLGGGVVGYTSAIKKCTVNNKFYWVRQFNGLSLSWEVEYTAADDSEKISVFDGGMLDNVITVNDQNVTRSSCDNFMSYLHGIITDPVSARTDGEIEIFIQDASSVNDRKALSGYELELPEDYSEYSAVDFIGVEYKDLYEYSQINGGYSSDIQVIPRFWIEGLPYTFYGEITDSYGNVTDESVRGLEVDKMLR